MSILERVDVMPVQVLLSVHSRHVANYCRLLKDELASHNIETDIHIETDTPALIDYIIYSPDGPIHDFTPFTQLKAILSLWAGVETLVRNQTVPCPIVRMVESGMQEGMTEWVTGHVLRHHLGLDQVLDGQDGVWRQRQLMPPLARDRCVAVMGLGALGSSCALSLGTLNFNVIGWSRTAKEMAGIECRYGQDGLYSTVADAEIIVLLLPHTSATENIVNSDLLARFRRNSVLINSGRGALIDDKALLAALDSGHLKHATLDVFREEPLPLDHPFWDHHAVTVSPHIAADTRAQSAMAMIGEHINRGESGRTFLNLVDRTLGY